MGKGKQDCGKCGKGGVHTQVHLGARLGRKGKQQPLGLYEVAKPGKLYYK